MKNYCHLTAKNFNKGFRVNFILTLGQKQRIFLPHGVSVELVLVVVVLVEIVDAFHSGKLFLFAFPRQLVHLHRVCFRAPPASRRAPPASRRALRLQTQFWSSALGKLITFSFDRFIWFFITIIYRASLKNKLYFFQTVKRILN